MKETSGRKRKMPLRLTGIILAAVMLVGVFACSPVHAGLLDAIAEAAGEIVSSFTTDEEAAAAGENGNVAAATDNVEGSATATGRIEGAGFATPEEAAIAYINGLVKGSIAEMFSACSIESFVDHYDLERQIYRSEMMMLPTMSNTYFPANGEIERELNIEIRRGVIAQMIKYQYLVFMRSKAARSDNPGIPAQLKDYDSAAAMIEDYFRPMQDLKITFEGKMIPLFIFTDTYYRGISQLNLARTAYAEHADQIGDIATLLYVDDKPFLLMLGTECFDGRWYIASNSTLAAMAGLMSTSGGAMELMNYTEVDQIKLLTEDETLKDLSQKISQAIAGIDAESIMSLPMKEQREPFLAAYEEALRSSLTDEELELLDID